MRIILALFALIAVVSLAFPSSGAFEEVKEKHASILSAKKALAYSQSSYLERLSNWKRYNSEEAIDKDNAPKNFYVFYDTGKDGKVSYRELRPDGKTGIVPLSSIESGKKSHEYEYGTQGVFSKYIIDEEREALEMRRTTQYYLKERAAYAKQQLNAAKKALEAEGINNLKLSSEIGTLYKSIDRAEFDIAFASEPNEIAFAADMLKNDLEKTREAVKKAYSLCAKKNMAELMVEAEKEKGGEGNPKYFAGAQGGFESANSYFTPKAASDFIYSIKMLFRWAK